jgi:short-subunit dehydrogenase
MQKRNESYILLGASRGLGWHTYLQLLKTQPDSRFLISSRKVNSRNTEVKGDTTLLQQDFSKPGIDPGFLNKLKEFKPTQIIYFAGGGPYGLFQEKKWSDHQWALQTSFLYPAELLHSIMSQLENWPQLKKFVFIGSAVAEDKPDPRASSYSAAKHAMRGLLTSIKAEQDSAPKILLFSPPYMQTDLLPAHSQPRLSDRAENPEVVAERLIEYIEKT